ncbi:MAG: hypothetical protein JXB36_11840 [Gammaproteobacteria bacterium]|nr:hypothetical protein [Gammaproteobacteria bacterium]
MKRDKPTEDNAGIGFEITDTVLTEIDSQLAGMLEAAMEDASVFDFDFDAALDESGEKKSEDAS